MKWLVLFSMIAWGKKNKVPCWVTQPCAPYTSQEYLIGVGSGSTIEEADAAALGAITRQFSVAVKQRQTATKELVETKRGDELVSTTDHQNLRTQTEVESSMTLFGAQIASHFQTKETVYSLAIVERSAWTQNIDEQRRKIQQQVQSLQMQMHQTQHLLDRLPIYREMTPLVRQDEHLYQQRKIIDSQGLASPPSPTQRDLEQQRGRDLGKIHFVPIPTTDSEAIPDVLEQAWRAMGYQCVASPREQQSVIYLEYTAKTQQSPPDQYGFMRLETNVVIDLRTPFQTIATVTRTAVSSSRDPSKAQRGLHMNLVTELKTLENDINAVLEARE